MPHVCDLNSVQSQGEERSVSSVTDAPGDLAAEFMKLAEEDAFSQSPVSVVEEKSLSSTPQLLSSPPKTPSSVSLADSNSKSANHKD